MDEPTKPVPAADASASPPDDGLIFAPVVGGVDQPLMTEAPVPVPEISAEPVVRGDRWAHRRVEPRGLALIWTIYLLGATVVSFGGPAARGTLDTLSGRFAARELLVLVGVGVAFLWPLIRLSQAYPDEGGLRSTAKDLVVILMPATAVVLPMALMAAWPLDVALGLASATLVWTLLIGAVLGFALSAAPGVRSEGGQIRRMLWTSFFAGTMGLPALMSWTKPELDSRAADLIACCALPGFLVELCRDRHWSGQAATVLFEHWLAILMTGVFALSAWLVAAGLAPSPRFAKPADAA